MNSHGKYLRKSLLNFSTIGLNLNHINLGAGNGIRTHEHLRDWTLNPAPLTWLGNPRKRCRHPHAVVVFNCIRTTSPAALLSVLCMPPALAEKYPSLPDV